MTTSAVEHTISRLEALRAELVETDAQLAVARKERNAGDVTRLSLHAETLREFIVADESQSRAEVEAYHKVEAERILTDLSADYRASIGELDARIEDAQQIVRDATRACGAVYEFYNKAQWAYRALELLRLRFPDLGGAKVAPPPAPPNIAVALFDVEGRAVDTVPRPVLPYTASMTPEQRIAVGYEGLGRFIEDYLTRLPTQVGDFFTRAGAAPGATEAEQAALADDGPAVIGMGRPLA